MKSQFAPLFFFVASAAAHATWQQIWVNGVDGGTSCLRKAANNNPIPIDSPYLACNQAVNSANVCTIAPGDKVTVEMHAQHNERTCENEALSGKHYGPILVYMAAVANATTAAAETASWFKVHESGMVSNNPNYYAVQVLNDNCGHWAFTVPDVAPGHYLIRAEAIALHVASSVGGAQFYPGCFQVNVVGSGTAKPSGVKIPGVYSPTDPGILFDLYSQPKSYPIPGPRPYGYSAPALATTAYPTTATWNTALQPTTVPTTTPSHGSSSGTGVPTSQSATLSTISSSSTANSAAPSATQVAPSYGQCGGQGWTGPTPCAPPYTCKVLNQYYHQCS